MSSIQSYLFIYNQLIYLFVQFEVLYSELQEQQLEEVQKIDNKVKWINIGRVNLENNSNNIILLKFDNDIQLEDVRESHVIIQINLCYK